MNKEEFIDIMHHPDKLDSTTLDGLRTLVNEFPYAATARILLSVNQYKEKNVRYESELRTTAIYAGDRGMLKKHIDRAGEQNVRIVLPDEEAHPSTSEQLKPTEKVQSEVDREEVKPKMTDLSGEEVKESPIVPPKEQVGKPESEADISMSIQELKDIVNRHIDELEKERLLENEPVALPSFDETEDDSGKPKSKDEILNEFIRNQPSISRPKAAFFNPAEKARESIVDQESIISETLATIYYDQGHLQKAVKIYQKLSLKYPEKSTYFAALIKKAEKELNT